MPSISSIEFTLSLLSFTPESWFYTPSTAQPLKAQSMPRFSVNSKVWYKNTHPGVVLKDLGILKPQESLAPLAEPHLPEQAYQVEVQFPHFKDVRGCWESDLEPRV